jgi:hypothetical protein
MHGRRDEEDAGDDDRRGRGSGEPKKKQDATFYVLGLLTLGALVGVGAWLAKSSTPEPQKPSGKPGGVPVAAAPGSSLNIGASPVVAPVGASGGSAAAPPPPPPAFRSADDGGDGPASGGGSGGIKAAVRDGAPGKPRAETYKEAANPPTGGNYGKSQAEILVMLRDSRASVVTDLPHLPDAPADVQAKIDADVAKIADPNAGSERVRAQDRLVKIGRAAIPRVLAVAARLDFSRHASVLAAADDCFVADAVDGTLREITGYQVPPQLQYSPQTSKLSDYQSCIDQWYLWWLTTGYKRETFYKEGGAAGEDEKL